MARAITVDLNGRDENGFLWLHEVALAELKALGIPLRDGQEVMAGTDGIEFKGVIRAPKEGGVWRLEVDMEAVIKQFPDQEFDRS